MYPETKRSLLDHIVTSRLCLRPLMLSDAKVFLESLQGVSDFLSKYPPKNEQEALLLINEYRAAIENGTAAYFAIGEKISGTFVGLVGVYQLETDGPERHCWIRKEFQGRGYAYEAISAFMKWLNDYVPYDTIYSSFDVHNLAMHRLNEKLGGKVGSLVPESIKQESDKVLDIVYYEYHNPKKFH